MGFSSFFVSLSHPSHRPLGALPSKLSAPRASLGSALGATQDQTGTKNSIGLLSTCDNHVARADPKHCRSVTGPACSRCSINRCRFPGRGSIHSSTPRRVERTPRNGTLPALEDHSLLGQTDKSTVGCKPKRQGSCQSCRGEQGVIGEERRTSPEPPASGVGGGRKRLRADKAGKTFQAKGTA